MASEMRMASDKQIQSPFWMRALRGKFVDARSDVVLELNQ
jgi:hypothetical protein